MLDSITHVLQISAPVMFLICSLVWFFIARKTMQMYSSLTHRINCLELWIIVNDRVLVRSSLAPDVYHYESPEDKNEQAQSK